MNKVELKRVIYAKQEKKRNYFRNMLHNAISNDDTLQAGLAVHNLRNMNFKIDTDMPAIILAVKHNRLDIARIMLEKDADANARSHNDTCLTIAISNKNAEMVKLLLEYQAIVNPLTNKTTHPLVLACRQNKTDLVRILLETKAKVNPREMGTCLHYSLIKGNTELAGLLCEYGAKLEDYSVHVYVRDSDADHRSSIALSHPLESAFYADKLDSVKYIVENGNIEKSTLFAYAINFLKLDDDLEIKSEELSDYIVNGGDIELASDTMTPLMVAAISGDEKLVKSIVKCGVDIDAVNSDNMTALHMAILTDKLVMGADLIQYGANIDIKDHLGRTARHIFKKHNINIRGLIPNEITEEEKFEGNSDDNTDIKRSWFTKFANKLGIVK